jgi:hypothetical protein
MRIFYVDRLTIFEKIAVRQMTYGGVADFLPKFRFQ